jgi:hypothetical protein
VPSRYNALKITFSQCVHLLSTEMIRRREDGQEMAVLEAIAALGLEEIPLSSNYGNKQRSQYS